MLNDRSKKKKNEAIDPYLKHNYFDADNGDSKILNYQYEDRFEYPDYNFDRLVSKRQINITEGERKYESYLTPLYGITGFFAAVFIIGPFLVKQGPNRGIVQASIMLSAFCMWIFWFTIYFGQMNPLMGPRLENTTVAWIAYKLGNPVPPPPPPPDQPSTDQSPADQPPADHPTTDRPPADKDQSSQKQPPENEPMPTPRPTTTTTIRTGPPTQEPPEPTTRKDDYY